MRDQAHIYIVQHGGPADTSGLYLHSEWGGGELPLLVRRSLLRARERWDDEPYLARVLFCDLVEGSERDLTGYGISTYLLDNAHPVLVVDCATQRIGFSEPGDEPRTYRSWTFEAFVILPEELLLAAYGEDAELSPAP